MDLGISVRAKINEEEVVEEKKTEEPKEPEVKEEADYMNEIAQLKEELRKTKNLKTWCKT